MLKLFPVFAIAFVATSASAEPISPRGLRTEAMEYQAGITPQCYIENGWDYGGIDLSAVSGRADECCNKCYELRGCEAWTWTDYNGGTCWLKEWGRNLTWNPNAKSSRLFVGTRPTCEIIEDYDFVGNDIGNVKSDKAENCCGICQGYTGCRTFSWSNHEGGTCWLKGAYNGQLVAKAGVRSGSAYPFADSIPQCASATPDLDYVGNDIGNQEYVHHPSRCCELCRATDNCRAYSWTIYNGGTCYLKSKTGDKVFKQGVVSATVWPNVDEKCSMQKDRDYAGQDIGNAPSTSADQCCSQCRAKAGCKAWSWTDYNGGTCWFKRGNAFPVNKPGAIVGVLYGNA